LEGLIDDRTPISSNKERAALESQIGAQNAENSLLLETEGIDIYCVNKTSKEDRLKLRLYLAQRIQRIDLTFGVTVLTAGGRNFLQNPQVFFPF